MYWLLCYSWETSTCETRFENDTWEGSLVDWLLHNNYWKSYTLVNAFRISKKEYDDYNTR